MILYDKKKNGFDVYEMLEREKDTIEYRKKEMKNGKYDTNYLYSRIRDYYFMSKDKIFGNYTQEQIASTILSKYEFDKFINERILIAELNFEHLEFLLKKYYNGDYKLCNIARFKTSTGIRNFLLTSEQHEKTKKFYFMDDILELPKSLYILQILEQGRFKLLEQKDISEQLELFTLSKIDEVSIQELQKMDDCGVTKNACLKTSSKADDDAYVLKLLRK